MPLPQSEINPTVPVPKPSGKHHIWLWAILVLAVIIVVAFKARQGGQENQESTQPPASSSQQAAQEKIPTLEDTQKMLEKKSQTTSPQFELGAEIEAAELPDKLKNLVLPNAVNLSIKKLSLAGGKSGFEIKYTAPEAMDVTYRKLLIATSQWQAKIASRALLATLIERESDQYWLKITQTATSENQNQVLIQAFEK